LFLAVGQRERRQEAVVANGVQIGVQPNGSVLDGEDFIRPSAKRFHRTLLGVGHLTRARDVRLDDEIEAEEDLRRSRGPRHVSPHRERSATIVRTNQGLKGLNERVSDAKKTDAAILLGRSSLECDALKR
jgi:hypothetical protein